MAASPVLHPVRHYLNTGLGVGSWLFTRDHKRIALLYLGAVTFFFFVGGAFAVLIRLELATPAGFDRERLVAAAATLNEARTISRVRRKGMSEKRYDLRPLLSGLRLEPPRDPNDTGLVVLARTRIDPELGAGRPDEVVAALADACGVEIETRSVTRQRLLLAGDPLLRAPAPAQSGRDATLTSPPRN